MEVNDSPRGTPAYQGSGDNIHEKQNPMADHIYNGDHGAETALRRTLSTRHLTMIALGSSIGMGLWLGSGKSLASGGPAGIFLGYCLAGSMIWCVSHSIGEMACMYPLPSAFVQWTGKFIDPSAAFALGWSYWFSYCITIANELQATNTIINFWTSAVPVAAWISIWFVVIVLINVGAVNLFGEIEVVASTIKFGWIFVVIISMIVMSAGGASYGPVGFRYWNEEPFTNGFKGFLNVMPTCIFAMSGSENSGLVAAETANPRKSIPRAVSSIWVRLSLFYLLGSLMITINVDPHNPNLFGQSGTNASPFVIAYFDAGLPALAHIMNAIILISVISTGSISGYGGSRTTMGLAHLQMAPKKMQYADRKGRPWYGLVPTFILGGGLAYLNVSESGSDVFTWFSNLTSLFTLFGWGMICLSHIRFRAAWARQGHTAAELPWRSWIYPYGPWWGLVMCVLLIIVQFYLSVWPLGDAPSAENFFANYISIILIVVMWLGARLYYRGRWWIDLDTINLDEGRRFYGADVEKVEAKGALGKAKKVIGAVLN
ncbi:amino acid permease/ SLC12A domain-containing protein [Annulohypoxylon truncatum]|uniref:amino acid permease/ SLC12A domain-containing protein n=1 Tax=Annulohypoxylon truncatum TaxID=327061 RepID=UPI00200806EE|nr:amino acid permease/ SLC12A domain-containing protein [Annulohypoxylon truncatum]KAI1215140.1 amino acid permease/ SLC12A domain-containing protein [Annulohypoxylon truncatum]